MAVSESLVSLHVAEVASSCYRQPLFYNLQTPSGPLGAFLCITAQGCSNNPNVKNLLVKKQVQRSMGSCLCGNTATFNSTASTVGGCGAG